MWVKRGVHMDMVAELATLRERVAALTAQVEELKDWSRAREEAIAAERARSDSAVDRMLGQHGIPPVTPIKSPTLEDLSSMFEEDPTEVRNIKEAIKERGAENVLLGTE